VSERDEEGGSSQDPEARRFVRDTVKERNRQQAADALFVCGSPQGQRFLAWLLAEVGLYNEVFNEAPRRSAFDEGRKSVGNRVRRVAIATGSRNWLAIEAEVIARRIEPTNKPKEKTDE
jgi:hypothetical protein